MLLPCAASATAAEGACSLACSLGVCLLCAHTLGRVGGGLGDDDSGLGMVSLAGPLGLLLGLLALLPLHVCEAALEPALAPQTDGVVGELVQILEVLGARLGQALLDLAHRKGP